MATTGSINMMRRVNMRGGWIGLFSGESQGAAIERILPGFNSDGYKVGFIIKDEWSLGKKLLNALLAVVTLYICVPRLNMLIIGELVD